MILMTSDDGISWQDDSIIQLSPEEGWASRCITSCDARYKENEETWYCYYSAIGRKEGDELSFGGLLGAGPVMHMNRSDNSVMIARGGRIPAPLQSLKN